MNATGLPIPAVSTPPTPTQTTADASPSAANAPTDFMLALAQMLGVNVPTADAEAPVVVESIMDSDADTDSSDDAAALALLPLPIVPMQTQMPQAQVKDFDPLELLGLNPRPKSAGARDAALLQALTERLAAAESDEAAQPAATNTTFMPSIDSQQPVRTTSDGAITRPVHIPVGTRAWADEIGSRLTMMTEKGQHTASLRLSPEHLGPLEIRIAMRDDQASVWFGAAHADTRAAIEHALPRLRELFAAQGMSLADAGVFKEPPRQQMPTFASNSNALDNGAATETTTGVQVKVGLLDAYA